jgi:hypothetical protein
MPQITINATDEQIKAVNGIVVDATAWLQAAFDGKAANCTKRVMLAESNLNPGKMSAQEQSDWIRDNTFPTRVERDNAANPPTPPGPPTP